MDVVVTVGQTLSQKVSQADLCETMRELVDQEIDTVVNCQVCDIRLMRTEFEGIPSIIASVPGQGKKCTVAELMKRRLP